ncbi:competence protein CoiA family protein [Vibrio sp. YYF0003]|uniref:competence protein CoiA family protein n=1 Tax=Vibrio sp. YYF0003 TaxID=3116646 RepID=UPI002EA5D6C1|nr:competence protein CoiA family protein [Vibrio sp. YYF0003]
MSEIHITRAVYTDTKESVSIEAVNSGLQDNVVCACCGAKLVANKGKKKAWHFSHYFDEACALAYETQLHLTAKEYFANVGKIPIPLEAGWVSPYVCSELKISGVQIEVYMDGRRPDLVVEVGSEQYWIEIANKHKCDADKVWDCRAYDKNVIEIDVSDCGHLDQFDSLDHCLVRIQSLNVCNDYLDDIATNTAHKHETVRKQFEALTRSQKQLEEKEFKQIKAEKTLEERVEAQQKKHDSRLEKMRLRESAQNEILAELERAIGAHEVLLNEAKVRRSNLENEINDKASAKLVELEELNKATLERLKGEFESQWQLELHAKRERFEQELNAEFQRRFQNELDEMNSRTLAHEKLGYELKIMEHEKTFLCNELETLGHRNREFQKQQESQLQESISPLIEQRNTLNDQIAELTRMIEGKMIDADLIDTYANNLAEVREFCLARTDYRQTLNQRMKVFRSIERQCNELRVEYKQKSVQLDAMVKLSNDFVKAFKSSFDLLQRKELLEQIPEILAKRVNKNSILLSRNAQEELDDFELMDV